MYPCENENGGEIEWNTIRIKTELLKSHPFLDAPDELWNRVNKTVYWVMEEFKKVKV